MTSRIFVVGDIHGEIDIKKLYEFNSSIGKNLTKDDYVVILGDFGLLFDIVETKTERRLLRWLSDRAWTTLVVDGNHENFDRLNAVKTTTMFGDEVGVITHSIFHLKRGRIYSIANYKCFVMGGALSIDKNSRVQNVSWWVEEEPSYKEIDEAFDRLDKHDWKVDFVFTHTAPEPIAEQVVYDIIPDSTSRSLTAIAEKLNFKHWYFAHFHKDMRNIEHNDYKGLFSCYYETIEQIV